MWTVGSIRQMLQLDTMGIHFELIEPNRVFFVALLQLQLQMRATSAKTGGARIKFQSGPPRLEIHNTPHACVGVYLSTWANSVHMLLIKNEAKKRTLLNIHSYSCGHFYYSFELCVHIS